MRFGGADVPGVVVESARPTGGNVGRVFQEDRLVPEDGARADGKCGRVEL
jgi:hypothetical protein